jgi:hypothetical protein
MSALRSARLIFSTACPLLVASCIAAEAFPTIIDNQSDDAIHLRYLASGHDRWSALWDIPPGEAQSLAQDYWVQDIVAIRVREGRQIYRFAGPDMQRLRKHCDTWFISRALKLSPDCYIRYLGDGHWTATLGVPTEVKMRLNRSLQPSG